jgi:serine/threonine-protein kinase
MIEHEPEPTIFERRDPLIGTTLDDRFRIDARLAAGGFGSIYRAADLRSGQDVALKVMHANLAANAALVARFRREAATLASLRDPHTVAAYELGETADGTLYIAMELLRGETLYDVFRKHGGPLPWRRVVAIARAVCSSLVEAHERGIVHRDLKPANIHLQERDGQPDFVKVLDFGIAKVLHGSELEASELTVAGQMIGTFDYMAPEQMLGGTIGAPCDLYTLGVVMYEMIAGRLPYADATNPTQLLAMLLTTAPARLTELAPVPPALERVVMRCLEREQQDRYQSAAELAGELDRVLAGGAPEEAARTAIAPSVCLEDETRVGHRAAESRVASARAASARQTPARGVASARQTPARGVASARQTPAHGARLRAAVTPAHPIEPAGEVRAQGSQPTILPDGRGSQPRVEPCHARPAVAAYTPAQPAPVVAAHPYPHAPAQPYLAAPAQPYPLAPAAYLQHADPRVPRSIGDGHGSQPYVDPRAPYPVCDGHGSQPYADPRAPYPVCDARGSQPYVDPRAAQLAFEPGHGWQQPQQPWYPGGATAFDAARDAAVRRVVWLLVLVLGCVLAAVVAQLL